MDGLIFPLGLLGDKVMNTSPWAFTQYGHSPYFPEQSEALADDHTGQSSLPKSVSAAVYRLGRTCVSVCPVVDSIITVRQTTRRVSSPRDASSVSKPS